MIEKAVIDGKPATLAYIKDGFEPCSKDEATLIKIIFDDGGSVFVVPDQGGVAKADWNEDDHPRDESGKWAEGSAPADFTKNIPEAEEGFAYHATTLDRLQSISEDGLLQTFGPDYGTEQDMWPDGSTDDRSYWTSKPSTAVSFVPEGGQPVLLRVSQSNVPLRREVGTGDLYSHKAVSTKHLEYFGRDKSWHQLKGE